jgi:predicted metalloprotease with PDZ domain
MLDFDILEKTKLTKSYRNVHNMLYQEYRIPKTFNDNDVKDVLKKVTGEDYSAWWATNVDGFAKPDFDKLLAKAGLEIGYGKEDKKVAWTGLSTQPHASGLLVTSVEKGSPAWNAGFTTDDIIIAVDGLRIADKNLTKRLANFSPNMKVSFTAFRRDELMDREIKLGVNERCIEKSASVF